MAFEGARLDAYDGAASVPGLSAFARRIAAPAVIAPLSAPAEVGESPADSEPLN